MRNIIINAYKDVENLNNFDEISLKKHRIKRLQDQDYAVNYIKEAINHKISLLDIGSGSSALAYSLVSENILNYADCVEPSLSRFNFAEKWKKDTQCRNVNNHNIDVANYSSNRKYNAITIIDNTFSYIGLYYDDNEMSLLVKKLHELLIVGGILIIDVGLYNNFINQINASTNKVVQEFEVEDSVGLWEYRLIEKNIMNIKSTYIDNTYKILKKEENSKIYNLNEIVNLFSNVGFKELSVYSDFNKNSFIENKSDRLTVMFMK
jgi:hypothetical protein